MNHAHCCEHTEEDSGACEKCRHPMLPRPVKFVGSKREWILLYGHQILKRCKSLSDILDITKNIGDDNYGFEFMIMCPNAAKLSIEVVRELGV